MKKICFVSLLLFLALALSGCGAAPQGPQATCQQIAQALQNAADFQPLTAMTDKYIEKYLLVDGDQLSQAVMLQDATRATPEMILVLAAADEKNADAVQQAAQDFLEEQRTAYRDYQPDEMPKLEKARVQRKGMVIVLVVSPDAEKTDAALAATW